MKEATNHIEEARLILNQAVDCICWNVSVGGCSMPSFSLALGEKIKRTKELRNPAQPREYRAYKGSVSFVIWCTWRLESDDEIVANSDESEQLVRKGLAQLIGTKLQGGTIAPPAWDLNLRFSNGWALKAFCDHTIHDPSFDGNWECRVGNRCVFTGPGTRLKIE